MNSREKILAAVYKNNPEKQPLPEIVINTQYDSSFLIRQFMDNLEMIGAIVVRMENIQIVNDELHKSISSGEFIINTIDGLERVSKEINLTTSPILLEQVDKVYIRSTLGVAENGAVWIQENRMGNRLLPFICQHLIIVLDSDKIVSNMSEAYKNISIGEQGYGVFLAGPSKTADIEHSLVIGAHGARSLKLYLLG